MEGFIFQDITRENFNKFCIGGFVDASDTSTSDSINQGHGELQCHQATADKGTNMAAQSPIGQFSNVTINPTPHAPRTSAVKNFSKSIKKDPEAYPTLTGNKFWEPWNKSFKPIAMNHGVCETLEPGYVPPTHGTDAFKLYNRQSTFFLMQCVSIKIKEQHCKTLVTNYLDTMDFPLIIA